MQGRSLARAEEQDNGWDLAGRSQAAQMAGGRHGRKNDGADGRMAERTPDLESRADLDREQDPNQLTSGGT